MHSVFARHHTGEPQVLLLMQQNNGIQAKATLTNQPN